MDQKPTLLLRLEHCWNCLKNCFGTIAGDSRATAEPDGEAGNVKQNGWRQGSILDDALVEQLTKSAFLPGQDTQGVWFMLSHDCDVTNHSFDNEPHAEVIFGAIIDDPKRKDGNKKWGKNSRLLQIENETETYEFNANARAAFPRVYLANYKPSGRTFDVESIWQIVCWVALRYNRRAFADEFNIRVNAAAKKLRKKLKQDGALLSGVFLLVSDEELDVSEDYELIVWASMRVEDHADNEKRKKANKLLGDIESELDNSDGISVEAAELRSEAEIGLSDIRVMKRWDYYNDLTLRDEDQDAIAPND